MLKLIYTEKETYFNFGLDACINLYKQLFMQSFTIYIYELEAYKV